MAHGRLRPGRAAPDARLRDERPRPRHEHLDGRPVRVSRPSRSTAARCSTPRRWPRIGDWGRYKDVDGDGIPYRTLPGTGMPAYFTRGSGHNEKALYSERPDDYVNNLDRLARKFDTARDARAARRSSTADRRARSASSPTARRTGRSRRAATSWRDEAGLETDYLRLRAYPFTTRSASSSTRHDRVYVVEQNRDGQMLGLLRLELSADRSRQAAQASCTTTGCRSTRDR